MSTWLRPADFARYSARSAAVSRSVRSRPWVPSTAPPIETVTVAVTVSIGGAVLGTHGRDLTDLLTAADLALYRAKSAGRNQVDMTAGSGDQHSGVEAGTLSPGSAYHSTGSPGS